MKETIKNIILVITLVFVWGGCILGIIALASAYPKVAIGVGLLALLLMFAQATLIYDKS